MKQSDTKKECPYKEDIQKAVDLSQQNNLQLEKLITKDWYSNKQLYEMIEGLRQNMTDFNENFHKYNGLVEKQQELKKEVKKKKNIVKANRKKLEKIEQLKKTKHNVYCNWRLWVAWIVSILLGISNLYLIFG